MKFLEILKYIALQMISTLFAFFEKKIFPFILYLIIFYIKLQQRWNDIKIQDFLKAELVLGKWQLYKRKYY